MPRPTPLSAARARRIALAAQGLHKPRPKGGVRKRHLRALLDRIHLLQLDSVQALIRTQYLPPFARLGPYAPELLDDFAYKDDALFEAWAHDASLVRVELEPLLRWAKARAADGHAWPKIRSLLAKEKRYVEEVYAEVKERGPIAASELSDPRRQKGEWWGARSLGTWALDALFRAGRVGVRRGPSFDRRYDLFERIVPEAIRATPTPSEPEALKALLLLSAEAYGVASANCLLDYFRVPRKEGRAALAELVEEGALLELEVGTEDPEVAPAVAYMRPGTRAPKEVRARALLSPFDPITWNRERARWLFGFDYKIEIYTPEKKRRYGYYVLPFLLGERLAARVDLKTDRKAGKLLALGAFSEDHADPKEVAAELAEELRLLAELVGASEVEVGRRGDLAEALRKELRARAPKRRPKAPPAQPRPAQPRPAQPKTR